MGGADAIGAERNTGPRAATVAIGAAEAFWLALIAALLDCVVESGSYRHKQRLRTSLRIVTARAWMPDNRGIPSTRAAPKESAPVRGAPQTSIVRLSRGDLRRLALKHGLLGGRYGYRPGLHRLWDHSQEVDLQKPVLQARALDLDMVGELEVAFEIPLGNALVDQVALASALRWN